MADFNWIWVLIPIAAITSRVVRDWLRLKAQQRDLGTSNSELEKLVSEMRQTNQGLAQRVENLEAIVVSQTWNAVQDPALTEGERERRIVGTIQHEVRPPAIEEVNRQRAEQLARRLGN
jgi:hypothetical protein